MKGTTYLIYDFLFDLPHWIRILLPVSLQSDNCFCEQNGKNTTILRAEANHHKVNQCRAGSDLPSWGLQKWLKQRKLRIRYVVHNCVARRLMEWWWVPPNSPKMVGGWLWLWNTRVCHGDCTRLIDMKEIISKIMLKERMLPYQIHYKEHILIWLSHFLFPNSSLKQVFLSLHQK